MQSDSTLNSVFHETICFHLYLPGLLKRFLSSSKMVNCTRMNQSDYFLCTEVPDKQFLD